MIVMVIVIVIREIHDRSWALMTDIMPKEVAESHRFTITITIRLAASDSGSITSRRSASRSHSRIPFVTVFT